MKEHWIVILLMGPGLWLAIGCESGSAGLDESVAALKSSYIDESKTRHHNLGWLAARSNPVSESISVQDPQRADLQITPGAIVIREVADGGPASDSGLQIGDVIVRVGDDWLPIKDDPTIDFFAALESRISAGDLNVDFGVIRDGVLQSVTLKHGQSSLDAGMPFQVARLDDATDRALRRLVEEQRQDGSFGDSDLSDAGRLKITAVAGLAILGAENKTFEKAASRCVDFVAMQIDIQSKTTTEPEPPQDADNTMLLPSVQVDIDPLTAAYVLQFLAESNVQVMDGDWMPRLMGLLAAMESRQTESENDSSNETVESRIDVLGTHTTNQVLLALGAWERKGMMGRPDTIANACAFLKEQAKARASGSLDRRTRAALNAGTAVALRAINCSESDPFFRQLVKDSLQRSRDVATSPVLGMTGLLSTARVARRSGMEGWTRFQNDVRILLAMIESPSGSFDPVPEKTTEVLMGIENDPHWKAAHLTMTLAMQHDPWKRINGVQTTPMLVVRNSLGVVNENAETRPGMSAIPGIPGGNQQMIFTMDDLSGEGSIEEQLKEKLKEMGIDSDNIKIGKPPGPPKK